jgi:hypothetical protein
MLTFEQAADIEYKKLNKLFEKADTPKREDARQEIQRVCREYERR